MLYRNYGALITSPIQFKSGASGCEGCARGSRRVSLEVKNYEDDRQALVVHAGYKSKWLQVDAPLNPYGSGAYGTRMKSAEKLYFNW